MYRLSSCPDLVAPWHWNLPGPGTELVSPALVGFLSTVPSQKSELLFFN